MKPNVPLIGYGGMLMESFVAIMALVAASVIEPGVYFTMNSPGAVIGTTAESAAAAVTGMGFPIGAAEITQAAADVGEHSIISRAGGAPTLAVGMAHIFHQVIGGKAMMAFWYHFAILFEALFILTAVDAGTRAGRFMLQDLLGVFVPAMRDTGSWAAGVVATALCVAAWGFFLYQGVTDPLGGVNTLWPLFGVANQMLAAVALTLCTVVIFRMKRERYAWVTILPTLWLVACTLTAGLQKILSADPARRLPDPCQPLRRGRGPRRAAGAGEDHGARCGRSSSTTGSTPGWPRCSSPWWSPSWSSASAPAWRPGAPSAGPRRRSATPAGWPPNDRVAPGLAALPAATPPG